MTRAAICLLVLIAPSMATARTWTAASGKATFDAELIAIGDGNVQLRSNKDGKEYTVPIELLSKDDRKFIANQGNQRPSKSTNPVVVPPDVSAVIRATVEQEWRGDKKGKQREIAEQMAAYSAIKSLDAPGVPKYKLQRMVAAANFKSPGNYKKQKLDIKQQVKAWCEANQVPVPE